MIGCATSKAAATRRQLWAPSRINRSDASSCCKRRPFSPMLPHLMNTPLLRLCAVIIALAVAPIATAAPADLVVRRANVITVDTNRPRAESFAVTAGKFVIVGNDRDVAELIGPTTKVLDLE